MISGKILVVDDEPDICKLVKEILEDEGYDVLLAENGEQARDLRNTADPDLILLDIWMPDIDGISLLKEWRNSNLTMTPVIMMSGHGNVETAVEATRLGAYDYLEKPIKLDHLLHCVSNALETSELRAEARRRTREQESTFAVDRIIGRSAATRNLRELVRRIAESEADTVLVQGESGTGKELVARALHYDGRRRQRPFRVVCGTREPRHNLQFMIVTLEQFRRQQTRGDRGALDDGHAGQQRSGDRNRCQSDPGSDCAKQAG